jgi:hypothetical protein
MAEWLRRGLQNLVHRFESGWCLQIGRVAELVYAVDLKSAGLTALRVRVPPRPPTKKDLFTGVFFSWYRCYN